MERTAAKKSLFDLETLQKTNIFA